MHLLSRISVVVAGLSAPLLAAGCGSGLQSTAADATLLHISGSVHGGQQPVVGASIQLYTVGTTGTASTAMPLIPPGSVVTLAGGNFDISGSYSCTNATQVYIVARGGDTGSGTNSASAMAVALGPCSSLSSGQFIAINEVSTVAAAYALAPFHGSSYVNIGGNPSDVTGSVGLPDAFQTAALLYGPTTLPAGITVPTTVLNTVANIIAACINTTGTSSTQCTQLFNVTGGTNTFDAAFFIASNPSSSAVTGLYSLSSSSAPFQPSLTSAPKDFSVAIKYAGTAAVPFSGPSGIAIDAAGNALITQQTGNTVVAVSPLSTALTTAASTAGGTLIGPQGISADATYIWIANPGNHSVVQLAGYPAAGAPFFSAFASAPSTNITLAGGVSNPTAIAEDIYGNAYTVSPAENKIYAVSGSTHAVSTTFSNAGFTGTGAFSFSGAQTLTVGNSAGQTCLLPFISANNGTISFSNSSATCLAAGAATSISALNYNAGLGSAGFVGVGNGAVAGAPIFDRTTSGSSYFLSSTASTPTALTFDRAGKAFIADNNAVFEYDISGNQISPAGGIGSVSTPRGIAVDPSGNVWTTNAGDNSVSIFVGLGAATVTPISSTLH